MTVHEKVADVWKEVPELHEKVSGTWKAITEGWERVAGVWKQFYEAFTVTLAAGGYTVSAFNGSGGSSAAGLRIKRNGNISLSVNNGGTALSYVADVGGTPNEWADPASATIGDAYHIRMLTTSGTLTAGTANSWLALTSDRTFENTQTLLGSLEWTGRLQFSDDGGSSVLAQTGVFTIAAASELP